MCNCGNPVIGIVPEQHQDGDVLVQALYTPRQMGGVVTGRLYPRPQGANNYQIWVDPADAKAKPELFRVVVTASVQAAPAVEDVVRLAGEAMVNAR